MSRIAEEVSRNASKANLLNKDQPVIIIAGTKPPKPKRKLDKPMFELERQVEDEFHKKYGYGKVKKPNRKRRIIRKKILRKQKALGFKLPKTDYATYIKSQQWKDKRKEFIAIHPTKRCEICYGKENLSVHHHTYKRVGDEFFRDLALLCSGCHYRVHFLEDGTKTPLRGKALKERFNHLVSSNLSR